MLHNSSHPSCSTNPQGAASRIFLGIDPGLCRTGWGIIEKGQGGNTFIYVASGTVRSKPGNISARLTNIFRAIKDTISQYRPHSIAIERTYVNINFATSLQLAHARSAAIVACGELGCELLEYDAKTVKKVVTGNGNADKAAINKMLSVYFYGQELTAAKRFSSDEADALAIAICHACHS